MSTSPTEAPRHLPLWATRAMGLGLALLSAKTIMVAQHGEVDLTHPLALPALFHDHLLVVCLFGGIDLFFHLRSRRVREDDVDASSRLMWFMLFLALLWVSMSVLIAGLFGAPVGLAEMRAEGGPIAAALKGASVSTSGGALVTLVIGLSAPLKLARAPRRRVLPPTLVLFVVVAFLGPVGRDALELQGLGADPFAVIIQATWQGMQAAAGH